MTPVHQTSFYPQGNCYAACVASILDLPLSDVPDFVHDESGGVRERWEEFTATWMAERGYGILKVLPYFEGVWLAPLYLPEKWYCIASGPSPRFDCNHAVVWGFHGTTSFPAHDPHPEGTFFGSEEIKQFDLIVPLKVERKGSSG